MAETHGGGANHRGGSPMTDQPNAQSLAVQSAREQIEEWRRYILGIEGLPDDEAESFSALCDLALRAEELQRELAEFDDYVEHARERKARIEELERELSAAKLAMTPNAQLAWPLAAKYVLANYRAEQAEAALAEERRKGMEEAAGICEALGDHEFFYRCADAIRAALPEQRATDTSKK